MSQRTICLAVLLLIAAVVLVDALWLSCQALPEIPAQHQVLATMSIFSKEVVEEQNAMLRSERGYAVDTAVGVAVAALFFGGFGLAFVILRPQD